MSTSRTQFTVRVLACCLTICQFSPARAQGTSNGVAPALRPKTKRTAAAKTEKVYATAAVRADEEELRFATAERADMGGYTVPRTWLSSDQTILNPIPLNGMLLTQSALTGTLLKSNLTAPGTVGTSLNSSSSSTSFGPRLDLSYGLSDNFYFTTNVAYMPSRSESQFSSAYLGNTNRNSTTTDDGWREPTIGVGATTRLGRQSRITFELDGDIPIGKGRTETSGTNSVSNGLSGGGAIRPKLFAVTRAGSVKLIGQISYTHYLERTTDTLTDGRTGSMISNGGNTFGTTAMLEFPRAYNLGFGGIYSRSEPTSTTTYSSYSPGMPGMNWQSSSPGQQVAGGLAYMGFAIPDTNIVLIPAAMYATLLDRDINGISVSQYDLWMFSFRGIVHF